MITELERQYIVEQIDQALVEMEESDEISQGSIDGLEEVLKILGVNVHERDTERQSD